MLSRSMLVENEGPVYLVIVCLPVEMPTNGTNSLLVTASVDSGGSQRGEREGGSQICLNSSIEGIVSSIDIAVAACRVL